MSVAALPPPSPDGAALSPKPGYATLNVQDEQALGYFQVAAYSVGHVLNDMAAAVWFSYLLLYLQEAEGLSGTQAGAVMFAGQLADALATPLVGIASDASRGCFGLGRRKAWNAVGVAIVAFNFFLMFGSLLPRDLGTTGKAAALGMFAALFNVGWAAVQVSHMALVPELTRSEGMRVVLNSARYAFTVLSNCLVFLVVLGLVGLQAGPTADANPRYRDPALYSSLSHAVLGVGIAASGAFLFFCKEPTSAQLAQAATDGEARESAAREASRTDLLLSAAEAHAAEAAEGGTSRPRKGSGELSAHYAVEGWRDWLRVPDFWRIMGVYTLVRLSVNISQVYLTFFVTEALDMDQTAVAITPLLLYLAQLISTVVSRRIAVRLGRRRSIGLGSLLTVLACLAMGNLEKGWSAVIIYPSVVLLGAGLALSMVICAFLCVLRLCVCCFLRPSSNPSLFCTRSCVYGGGPSWQSHRFCGFCVWRLLFCGQAFIRRIRTWHSNAARYGFSRRQCAPRPIHPPCQ